MTSLLAFRRDNLVTLRLNDKELGVLKELAERKEMEPWQLMLRALTWFQLLEETPGAYDAVTAIHNRGECSCGRDAVLAGEGRPCNPPFERVPQHSADPGFGPVPPPPKPSASIQEEIARRAPQPDVARSDGRMDDTPGPGGGPWPA